MSGTTDTSPPRPHPALGPCTWRIALCSCPPPSDVSGAPWIPPLHEKLLRASVCSLTGRAGRNVRELCIYKLEKKLWRLNQICTECVFLGIPQGTPTGPQLLLRF